jgi:hypothetical protein
VLVFPFWLTAPPLRPWEKGIRLAFADAEVLRGERDCEVPKVFEGVWARLSQALNGGGMGPPKEDNIPPTLDWCLVLCWWRVFADPIAEGWALEPSTTLLVVLLTPTLPLTPPTAAIWDPIGDVIWADDDCSGILDEIVDSNDISVDCDDEVSSGERFRHSASEDRRRAVRRRAEKICSVEDREEENNSRDDLLRLKKKSRKVQLRNVDTLSTPMLGWEENEQLRTAWRQIVPKIKRYSSWCSREEKRWWFSSWDARARARIAVQRRESTSKCLKRTKGI